MSESWCISRTAPAATSQTMEAGAKMRGSATFMCRPVGHCCLDHEVGPVGVVRDPRKLEIPPRSGKAITTEALRVRSWLKPNAVWPMRVAQVLRI
jgi:hypothetical protein